MSSTEPKKDFDPDDPLEMVEVSADGNINELEETIVDEYISMGYSKEEIRALFENSIYQVPHGILLTKGPVYVNFLIDQGFEEWKDRLNIEQ